MLRRLAWKIGRWFCEIDDVELAAEVEGLRNAVHQLRDNQSRQRRDFDFAVSEHHECIALQKQMREQLDYLAQERAALALLLLRNQGPQDEPKQGGWKEVG